MKNGIGRFVFLIVSLGLMFALGASAFGQGLRGLPTSESGSAGAPSGTLVVDSKGQLVGPLVGEGVILRQVNGVWLGIGVSPQGFQGYGSYFYVFPTSNCTGPRYILLGGLPVYAYVNNDAPPSKKSHIIYGGTPSISIVIKSILNIINNIVQPCENDINFNNNQPQLVGPPQTVDITDNFGLVPPFKLK